MSNDGNKKPSTEVAPQMNVVSLPSIPRTTTREEMAYLSRRFDTHAELDARELGELKAQVGAVDRKLDSKTDRQTLILSVVVAVVGAIATIAAAVISSR